MRNLRNMRVIVLGLVSVLVATTVAFALTIPPTFAPRLFGEQVTHFFRINVALGSINGQGCVLASGTCSVKVGALPYNSFVRSVVVYPVTTFNSGTTDTIALGTNNASGSTGNIMAATSIHTSASASVTTTALAGFGLGVTGNSATPTGTDGGFDLWATYAQTGAVATQGQAIVILDYTPPNDGTCTQVPLGSTAGAC